MPKLMIQFDDDTPIEQSEIEENQPFSLPLIKVAQQIGKGITVKQESQVYEFTDGEKTFKIFIE